MSLPLSHRVVFQPSSLFEAPAQRQKVIGNRWSREQLALNGLEDTPALAFFNPERARRPLAGLGMPQSGFESARLTHLVLHWSLGEG
jgi:hypothetical protein